MANRPGRKHFFGSSTMSGKGQVVIPAEARKILKIKPGDKLLVFGMGQNIIALAKSQQLEQYAEHLKKHLTSLEKILKKSQ